MGSRSPLGQATRFYTKSDYSTCGIVVKSTHSSEIFILEPSVMRVSVFGKDAPTEVVVTGGLQSLRAKVFSGFHDMIAVRKVRFTKSRKILFATDKELEFCKNEPNPLTARLIELSKEIITFKFHPKKYATLLKDFYETDYLKNAPPEELTNLIAAEYMGLIWSKLDVFDKEFVKDISKLRPRHFLTTSDVKIPWLKEKIETVFKEVYIYLDYQVYEEELIIREKPFPPLIYPLAQKENPGTFLRDLYDLDKFQLSSGDLIFFEEVSEVAQCLQQTYHVDYTRVAMVVRIAGLAMPFIYDIPPFFLAEYQSKKVKPKLLEGRLISLDTYISSGLFKKIMVRKLYKKGQEVKNTSSVKLEPTEPERMKSIFSPKKRKSTAVETQQENLDELKEIVAQKEDVEKRKSKAIDRLSKDMSLSDIKMVREEGTHKMEPKKPDDNFTSFMDFKKKPVKPNKTQMSQSMMLSPRGGKETIDKEGNETQRGAIYGYVQYNKESDENWIKVKEFYKELVKIRDFGVLTIDISSLFSANIIVQSYQSLGLIPKDPSGWGMKKLETEVNLERDYYLGEAIQVQQIDVYSRLQSFVQKKEDSKSRRERKETAMPDKKKEVEPKEDVKESEMEPEAVPDVVFEEKKEEPLQVMIPDVSEVLEPLPTPTEYPIPPSDVKTEQEEEFKQESDEQKPQDDDDTTIPSGYVPPPPPSEEPPQ